MTKKYLALFYLLSAFSIPAAISQGNPDDLPHLTAELVNQNGLLLISEAPNWKYHPGDDIQWANPDYDDTGWYSIEPGNLSADAMPDSLWDGYGWWRLTFTADSSFYSQLTRLYFSRWGAAEIYLDGQKVHSFGQFSILADQEVIFTTNLDYHPAPAYNILPKDKHVLAVRYSNHLAKRHHQLLKQNAENLGFSIGFAVEDRNIFTAKQYKYNIVIASASGAILFLLGLLHLILFVKFPKDSSNLIISITVSLYFVSSISVFSPIFIDMYDFWYSITRLVWWWSFIIASFLLPYVVALVFRLESYYWSKHFTWLSAIVIIPTHYQAEHFMLLTLAAYLIIIGLISFFMYRAIQKKRTGVLYVIMGAAGTMAFASIWILDQLNIIFLSLELFFLIVLILYVSFPIGLSLFITNRYGVLFAEMEKEVSDRTLELQEKSKETSRQAAADRIRAEISSMRNIRDLQLITPLIWNELHVLGVPFSRCGTFIVDEEEETVQMHLSNPDGDALAATTLTFNDMDYIGEALQHWRNKTIFTTQWNAERLKNWTQMLEERGLIDSTDNYLKSAAPLESLHLHFVPFKQGTLYVGSSQSLGSDELKNVEELAEAFSVAYARYEDFRQLEQKNNELLKALQNLEAAQEQLVQQEKLASLGQLTAGIAHEIKNPLNFVNNFSEVSLELVEEARGELSAIGGQLTDILDDIEANLRKIHEHGSRADSIVKSMLMHSRGGSGKLEPTHLNALIKEYVNLSFHGMRAGKEPINVDIQLELDESVGDIPLITEDFSRVILNLCNNSFDAMRDKQGSGHKLERSDNPDPSRTKDAGDYLPKLTVRTYQSDSTITIEIEDNGPGIPGDIKNKILQPFFTTKKGTQGTGLGLSITNDIVKAHRGHLDIRSQPGKTVFQIELPV